MKKLIKDAQNIEIIIKLAGLFAIIYSIISFVYNNIYQRQCEEFYKIPAKYFKGNLDEKIMYLLLIMGLIGTVLYPILMRKHDKKENCETKATFLYYLGYMVIIGLYISVLNMAILRTILNNISENIFAIYNKHTTIAMVSVVIITYIGLIGILFLDKINTLKKLRKVILLVIITSILINALLLLGGTINILSKSIQDKDSYEIININNKKYVVLSEYDDKILAVPVYINKSGRYIFKTKTYEFIDRSQGVYKYIKLNNKPQIQ